MKEGKCIIQILGCEDLRFIGNHGDYTPDIQEASLFDDELQAYNFIDSHGLDRVSVVRKIH